ncbi:MAG TPA: zf-HC2 domain-containing protein [Ktedonobacterales bacterium]|nr:zf-HC2 domain-containing protein [Ktedonobacterales bacterium]
MSGIQTVCPLHMGAEQVSAFYDGDLDAPTAAALREHLATCDVCQQRLDSYTRIAATLRAQIAPQPDARLRQGILAARERGAGVSRAGSAWRAVALAATIAVIVGSFAGVLLRQARLHSTGVSSGPTVAAHAPTPPTELAPPGWRTLLPGRDFSTSSRGLAVSRARPGRLVGCSVSAPFGAMVGDPTLEISDDGGHSWQGSLIPDLQPGQNCIIVVDQVHPDTFVVGVDNGGQGTGQLVVTTDAGQSWRTLDMRTGLFELDGLLPPTLVNSHLIGMVNLSTPNVADEQALGDLSLDGKLTFPDSTLPYPDSASSSIGILAFAVDPTNAAHISAMVRGQSNLTHPGNDLCLYTTTNAGVTWRMTDTMTRTFPLSLRDDIHLWAPTPGALYFWERYPENSQTSNLLQMSTDGGVTWRAVTSASLRIVSVWFGPDGRIVLLDVPSGDFSSRLDELNPTTGGLTPLGAFPQRNIDASTIVITGGADPQIIVADWVSTFARPLP